jgi:hypothetical protein
MEFKTYRSPPRNKNGNNSHHDEEVPSLCSINSSGGAPTATSNTTAGHNKDATAGQSCSTTGVDKTPKTMIPTSSISVDPNKQDNPSPLASHECSSKMPSNSNQHNMRATTPPRSMMDMVRLFLFCFCCLYFGSLEARGVFDWYANYFFALFCFNIRVAQGPCKVTSTTKRL